MNDLLVDQRVDDRNGLAVTGTGGFFITALDSGSDLAYGAAHPRTQGNIACAVLLGLASGFFRGLGIGQTTLQKNVGPCDSRGPIQGAGSLLIDPPGCQLGCGRLAYNFP
jgi:hypothetical protein